VQRDEELDFLDDDEDEIDFGYNDPEAD